MQGGLYAGARFGFSGWLHSCTCNEELKLRRVKCKRPSGDMLDDLRYEFSDDE